MKTLISVISLVELLTIIFSMIYFPWGYDLMKINVGLCAIVLPFWVFFGGASYVVEDYRSNGGVSFEKNLKGHWLFFTICSSLLFFPILFCLNFLFNIRNKTKGVLNKKFYLFFE